MSKKVKSLFLGGSFTILLVAVMLILKFVAPSANDDVESEVSETPSTEVLLSDRDTGDVLKVTVTNEKDSFVLDKNDSGEWRVEELENLPTDELVLNSIADYAGRIVASNTVEENASDLSKYGLENPSAFFVAEFKDGSSYTLEIGDQLVVGIGYYVKPKDVNTVYTMGTTATQKFLVSKTELIDSSIMDGFADSDNENPEPDEIKLERDDLEVPLILRPAGEDSKEKLLYSYSGLIVTSPMKSLVNITNMDTYLNSAFKDGLSAQSVISYDYSEDEAADFGFDSPSAKLTYVTGDETIVLVAGDVIIDDEGNETNNYYLLREGVPVVYSVSKNSILWLSAVYKDIISSLIVTPNINYVEKVEITLEGKTYIFNLSDNENDLFVTVDGKEISAEYFRTYYKLLIAAPAEDFYSGEEISNTDAEIKFFYNDSRFETDTLKFYSLENRKTLVTLNESEKFIIRTQYIDHLKSQTEKIINNENVVVDF